jgi:GH24 family phage-related lysozyme (muramidase)
MHFSVLEAWHRFSEPLEGRVYSLYVDVKNLVTTGVGNLVDPLPLALQLPWKHEKTGEIATRDEVTAAWNTLKHHPGLAVQPGGSLVPLSKLHYNTAARLNDLRLTDEDIDALVAQKLQEFEAHLRKHHFHDWDSFPADAQLGILSMAWACGPGFPQTFKTFARVATAQDWVAAKASCAIRTAGNPGVVPRNRNNERCFLNAATVHDRGLDPSVLHWPHEAPLEGPVSVPIVTPLSDSDRARIAAEQFDPLDLDGDGFPDRDIDEHDTDPIPPPPEVA